MSVQRSLLIAAVLATLLVAGGLFLFGGERAFMAKNVAAVHAALEAKCERCHSPFSGASPQKCVACHLSAVAFKIHEQIAGGCGGCHFDHRGREVQLARVDAASCLGCHRQTLSAGKHPESTRDQCLFCHQHHAEPIFDRVAKTDLVFPHLQHVATPGLVQAPCASCHQLTPGGLLRGLPSETVCRSCHFGYTHDTRRAPREPACRLCHDPEHPATIMRGAGHKALSFAHDDHRAFACRECHQEVELTTTTAVPLPNVESCVRCHDAEGAKSRRSVNEPRLPGPRGT